uniref:Uncharacterized protein n=1 Tax=Aquisalinus luteolus TaxID=1566827 RepID=A0A8J3A479_9PROT|nr:hypothetical protein GCM10011355_30300 [Aquisalinus luteolus]
MMSSSCNSTAFYEGDKKFTLKKLQVRLRADIKEAIDNASEKSNKSINRYVNEVLAEHFNLDPD